MEKSPFALSVDNSLLDSIHPLSNSNSGKVSCAARRVCTYCINKQTRKHTAAPNRPAPVIRMCTYTSPRNKPDAEGKGGSCRCVCLENKNASFETCILTPTPLFSLALPLSAPRAPSSPPPPPPQFTPPSLPRCATGNARSPAFSRIFLPAFETSPARGFFFFPFLSIFGSAIF